MRRSIQLRRLAGSFALLVLLSFLIVFIVSYRNVRDNADREVRQGLKDQAESINSLLDGEVYNLDRIALGMLGNKDFVDDLIQLNVTGVYSAEEITTQKYEYQKLVDSLIFSLNTPILTSPMIVVFDQRRGYFFGWSIKGLDQMAINRSLGGIPWAEAAERLEGAKLLVPVRQNEWTTRADPVFSIVRAVMTTNDKLLGILEVQQRESVIEDICAAGFETQTVAVFNEQGTLIYPLESAEYHRPLWELLNESPEGSARLNGLTGTQLYASVYSEYTRWTAVVLRPADDVLHTAILAYRLLGIWLGIVLFSSLCAVFLISRRLTAPIRDLRAAVEQADAARPSLALMDETTNDEVRQLKRSFERLLSKIDLSAKQQVHAQQEEARAYLLALQSQMNPHFLYNTLNTIGLIAEENGQETVAGLSRQLVSMLRYISDFSQTKVPLAQEIAHAGQYLFLLKTRYEDGLMYTIHTEGDADAVQVPKLILQPLCENSYLHGLSAVQPPWHIDVDVKADPDGGFRLRVTDNGSGFSREALADLRARIDHFNVADIPATSIQQIGLENSGLINTYSRLFIEYEGRVSLSMDNLGGGGCTVTIEVRSGGDAHVVPADAGGG